ncbi:c-type cytochrome [Solitalea koreensis]|uniref:Cytochrome c n=1 Tax=Solitalea koreensis TaxID=543615 RepID=A0A521BR55_9SPHI|nr:c-type cytochrome [Solitalea koreensis]SMO49636.1 Cytochrome c [Solitalea koreensis]
MKKQQFRLLIPFLLIGIISALTYCTNNQQKKEESMDPSKEQLVERGKYLVTISSCNDCHSPKIMTPQGPIDDTTKLLSGHPIGSKLPQLGPKATDPTAWIQMTQDGTAFIGPWGISYAANLTPDETTGLGAWTEEVFIKTLRTGKHLGLQEGRQILPPMPWYNINKMTDDDLKAVYAYLHSLPPITNQVPNPVSPEDVAKMVTQ